MLWNVLKNERYFSDLIYFGVGHTWKNKKHTYMHTYKYSYSKSDLQITKWLQRQRDVFWASGGGR